jgi:hypothetical protein
VRRDLACLHCNHRRLLGGGLREQREVDLSLGLLVERRPIGRVGHAGEYSRFRACLHGEWPGEAIISPFYDRWNRAVRAECKAAMRMARTTSATLAGAAALLVHVRRTLKTDPEVDWMDWVPLALKTSDECGVAAHAAEFAARTALRETGKCKAALDRAGAAVKTPPPAWSYDPPPPWRPGDQ